MIGFKGLEFREIEFPIGISGTDTYTSAHISIVYLSEVNIAVIKSPR